MVGRSRRAIQPRPRRAMALALVGGVLASALSLTAFSAHAEDRDDLQRQLNESASRVSQIRQELAGVDANLQQLAIDLDSVQQKLPEAQSALDTARAAWESAKRQRQVVEGQLESARADQQRINEQIDAAKADEDKARKAIGGLARDMYRGGTASPVLLAMTAQGTEEIGDRAAAADALARSQNKVLGSAMAVQATQRNQASRQASITERVSALEEKAREAEEATAETKDKAESAFDELNTLKADAEAKKAQWESHRSEVQAQLDRNQTQYNALSEKIRQIDAENRKNNTVYVPPAPSGGGPFLYPLDRPYPITSGFGYRGSLFGLGTFHNGIDYGAPCGTPVRAIGAGVVTQTQYHYSGALIVYINHGLVNGKSAQSWYVHLQGFAVHAGQHVEAGQVVGYVGSTGWSTGCHLHLTLTLDGTAVDPGPYL